MSLQDALQWRYAAKRMNGQAVDAEKIDAILNAARLAPTSMGLQPFTIFVITDPALKEQVRKTAYNQPQVTEASHLLVFASWKNLQEQQVDEYMSDIMNTRGVSEESLAAFRRSIMGFVQRSTLAEKLEWAARQCYIAFAFAMAEAALLQVDSTPMEGFDQKALDQLLGLPDKGLTSITLLPLGYRDPATDILVDVKKVRRAADKLFVYL
jgi:nitroreductase